MSIGVLGDHGKIRLAFSPFSLKDFLIILPISLNTFAFSETKNPAKNPNFVVIFMYASV